MINIKELKNLLKEGNAKQIAEYMKTYNLKLEENKIICLDSTYVKDQVEYWDKRQLVRKLQLNSTYGALLNAGSRFFDQRLGQSVTLTGRQVVKHMSAETNKIITGEYDYRGKAINYNDTDSCIFSAYPSLKPHIDKKEIPWTKESIVELYDQIGESVNKTFADFMLTAFHCPKTRGEVIRAGREIVGTRALFITKKRYAILYYDKEGKRTDIGDKPGKIKAMGLDLRRSDTPEFMQKFLSEILELVLTGHQEQEILERINQFRIEFKIRPGWEKGTPKRANNITKYQNRIITDNKVTVPGHVRASINWNTLKKLFNDQYSMSITDGAKVIVCKLKPNPLGFTSVAYPVDELRLPQWFKDLPFDHDEMENVIINNKLDNLIGVLNFDLNSTIKNNLFEELFEF